MRFYYTEEEYIVGNTLWPSLPFVQYYKQMMIQSTVHILSSLKAMAYAGRLEIGYI